VAVCRQYLKQLREIISIVNQPPATIGGEFGIRKDFMVIQSILSALKAQRDQIDRAIAALEGSSPRRGRPPKPASHKRKMSADARKRIGLAMKLAWAKRKGKSAPKKAARKAAAKKPARKPMSPAARKKLADLMKARWAEKKKAGATTL